MSDRMKKYKRDRKALAQCSPIKVHHMIRKGDDDFIIDVWTTLAVLVELFTEQPAKIQSVQSVLCRFASRGQSVKDQTSADAFLTR